MGPTLSIASLNKVRRDELRVGAKGGVKTVDMMQWGFFPEHHILLEGIIMPPLKRSTVAQSQTHGCIDFPFKAEIPC